MHVLHGFDIFVADAEFDFQRRRRLGCGDDEGLIATGPTAVAASAPVRCVRGSRVTSRRLSSIVVIASAGAERYGRDCHRSSKPPISDHSGSPCWFLL